MEETDRLKSWTNRWNIDDIPWHLPQPNGALVKYWDTATDGRNNLRVLFPLCGASVDLVWLYRQGHTVVGVEGCRKAVEKLFTDADVEYDVDQVNNKTWRFNSKDSRLTVYIGDFFSITSELVGQFDAVFDRGALEAINETDRSDYLKIVTSCLKTGFTYILSGFEYDSSCKPGPPRPLPPAVVSSLFQGVGDVSILAKEEEEERRKKWNLTELHRYTYLIKNSN